MIAILGIRRRAGQQHASRPTLRQRLDLEGWATLRLLRADEALDDLAVAMFSVKGEVRDKVASLQDGAIDYITKPFGVDELIARVGRILDARGRGSNAVPTASPR